MAKGKVKSFDPQKGVGYIEPEHGGPDTIVFESAIKDAGLEKLPEGAKVRYDLYTCKGTTSAVNLEPAE